MYFYFSVSFLSPFVIIFWASLSQQQSFSKAFYQMAYFNSFSKWNYRTFCLGNLFFKKKKKKKMWLVFASHFRNLHWVFSANSDFLTSSRWFYAGCCLQLTKLVRDWTCNSECKFVNLQWEIKLLDGLKTPFNIGRTNSHSTNIY